MIKPCGDAALLIQFEQKIEPRILAEVTEISRRIDEAHIPGVLDRIPAYATLMIIYDPDRISFERLQKRIRDLQELPVQTESAAGREVHIPVLYGSPYPEDLKHVAMHAGLSEEEVIGIHTAGAYPVYMIGFLPGFPYLGNLDSRIHTPRRTRPRTAIRAGSVGIGGKQTGIYPLTSPGGWHIIGLTPVRLYDPSRSEPVLLRSGDTVHFHAVSQAEFESIEKSGGALCI